MSLCCHIYLIIHFVLMYLFSNLCGIIITIAITVYASGVLNYSPGTFDNYSHHWVDATAGGRFVLEGITSPVVNTSVLT